MLVTLQNSDVDYGRNLKFLSAEERCFVNAVAADDTFVVFQPIVDHGFKVQGFEILIRWLKDGIVRYPAEFLPGLQSKFSWMVLSEFVLSHAVKMINRFEGRYYFSINIPVQLIHEQDIVKILETARSSIINENYDSLVLEVNEKTSFERHPEIIDNIITIQEMGYRVFLDDCFSDKSAFFPVRKVKFDGYKIDMGAVNDCLYDVDCLALIQSLQHYCLLTNKKCIAEGIDKVEKIDTLRHLTKLEFQGALFGNPMNEKDFFQFIQENIKLGTYSAG